MYIFQLMLNRTVIIDSKLSQIQGGKNPSGAT